MIASLYPSVLISFKVPFKSTKSSASEFIRSCGRLFQTRGAVTENHRPPTAVCSDWYDKKVMRRCGSILANVNSRSRSLYAISRPSVVCLSVVCL